MKNIYFIPLLIACSTVKGQSKSYAAYLRLGVVNVENSGTILPAVITNVSGFTNAYYGIGGEFEYKLNSFIVAGDISIMAHGPVNNGDNYAEPFAGTLIGRVGIAVFERRHILVYPSIGGGLSGIFVNTYTKKDAIKTGIHSIHLVTPAIDLGVCSDVIIYRFRSESPTGILPVGFRSGYRFSTQSDNWKRMSGSSNLTKQLFANSGWYFSVALGIGYYSSGKKQ